MHYIYNMLFMSYFKIISSAKFLRNGFFILISLNCFVISLQIRIKQEHIFPWHTGSCHLKTFLEKEKLSYFSFSYDGFKFHLEQVNGYRVSKSKMCAFSIVKCLYTKDFGSDIIYHQLLHVHNTFPTYTIPAAGTIQAKIWRKKI